ELAEQHGLLSVTLRSIGDAVITTDTSARVVWLNPAAERLTGWLSDEARGLPVSQVFVIVHEDTREPVDSPVDQCLRRREVVGLTSRTLLLS
ncbi:PAS domain-containing protein, partial [Acinetobacter baumannii]